ncbi:MAG: hypothetical protein GY797_23815, partial [Deltaproteobacteria bacterium]|nr:hypothetical protein [Deltaproteobacteria bacterium]
PAIIENIRQLHKAETRFNVNYVLTPDNALDFPDFLSMMWDVEHPSFIGRNGRNKQPIPLGINFFRPQSLAQLKSIAKSYQVMENGLRLGFARTLNMIKRGINIQPLRTIDYLNLFNLTTIPCGAGFSYLAMGVHGVAPCHEGLFMMKSNLERIKQGENMFDLASEYFKGEQELLHSPNITFEKGQNLMFHGGQGCPRLAKKENNGKLGVAASTSKFYNAIYEELLSLETMRQLYRE